MNTTTKKAANSIVGKITAWILATAAVAAAAFPPPALALQSSGDSVLVVGDSLEVGSGPYLREALPGVSVDAEKGRTSSQGVRVLAERLDPSYGVIVFPLGTNDSPANPDGLGADLAAVRQLAGDRCIVVATLARPPVRGVSVAGLNRVVGQFAGQTGAQVVDWSTVVRAIPSLLVRDRVHATGEGYSLRASLIAEAVQGCAAGGGSAGASGIPAPRDPNARPPRRERLTGPPAVLRAPPEVGFVLDRAAALVAAAARGAVTAATTAGPEPVLGAP
jgi:lysophospholipase L1-like esterase